MVDPDDLHAIKMYLAHAAIILDRIEPHETSALGRVDAAITEAALWLAEATARHDPNDPGVITIKSWLHR